MFEPKIKVSFARILQMMKSFDSISGVYLLWDPTKKMTFKEYLIFKPTIPRCIICYTFLTISTLVVTKYSILSFILSFSVGLTIFGLSASLIIFIQNGEIVKNLLKWCENIYDIENKYHKLIRTKAETKLMTIERKVTKILKWFKRIYYFDGISFTLGFAILGIFLPENIYPKYSPPVPFYLPFKNQNTWLSFGCTTFITTLIAIDVASMSLYVFGLMICFAFHVSTYLDLIEETVEKFKEDVIAKTEKINDVEPMATSSKHSTLKLETLVEINASLTQEAQDSKVQSLSFDDWIFALNKMICDVNSIISSVARLYDFPNLFTELESLGSLFVCGFLVTVLRDQQFMGIGITIICALLYMVCYINEMIADKFDSINEALYDIPWYNLKPCQVKSLMMLMHCDKIQNGFMAAGIHFVTIERFGLIVKAGYTNFLVLKDLFNK